MLPDYQETLKNFLESKFYQNYKDAYIGDVMDDCPDEEVIVEIIHELRSALVERGHTAGERGEKQVRRFEVQDHKVVWKEVAEGTEWASGWEERVHDDTAEFAGTAEDGIYLMSFVPVGENLGMDSYEDVTFTKETGG